MLRVEHGEYTDVPNEDTYESSLNHVEPKDVNRPLECPVAKSNRELHGVAVKACARDAVILPTCRGVGLEEAAFNYARA